MAVNGDLPAFTLPQISPKDLDEVLVVLALMKRYNYDSGDCAKALCQREASLESKRKYHERHREEMNAKNAANMRRRNQEKRNAKSTTENRLLQ